MHGTIITAPNSDDVQIFEAWTVALMANDIIAEHDARFAMVMIKKAVANNDSALRAELIEWLTEAEDALITA
jgi:hypothetical protein